MYSAKLTARKPQDWTRTRSKDLTEIRGYHVEPDIQAQRREEAEELRFHSFGFLEENIDTQGQEWFGEIDGLE